MTTVLWKNNMLQPNCQVPDILSFKGKTKGSSHKIASGQCVLKGNMFVSNLVTNKSDTKHTSHPRPSLQQDLNYNARATSGKKKKKKSINVFCTVPNNWSTVSGLPCSSGTDLTWSCTYTQIKGMTLRQAHFYPSLFCLPSAPFHKSLRISANQRLQHEG